MDGLEGLTEKRSLNDLWLCVRLLGLGLIIAAVVAVVEITGCHLHLQSSQIGGNDIMCYVNYPSSYGGLYGKNGAFKCNGCRGKRAGKQVQDKIFKIETISTVRNVEAYSKVSQKGVNHANLRCVPRVQMAINPVKFCHLNAQSVRNKAEYIKDYINEKDLDVCAISETWLYESDDTVRTELLPEGYKIKDIPRGDGTMRGGGVGIVVKSQFDIKIEKNQSSSSFEYMVAHISYQNLSITVVTVYRPDSNINHAPVSTFLDEFCEIVSPLCISASHLLTCGDFNFHVENNQDSEAKKFMETLSCLNLVQHVKGPTHRNGGTLDLLITREGDNIIGHGPVVDHRISDHDSFIVELNSVKPKPIRKVITYRKLKGINMDSFRDSLVESELCSDFKGTAGEYVELYDLVLSGLLDLHAPTHSSLVTVRDKRPWISEKFLEEKRKCRQLERKWRQNKSDEQKRKDFVAQRNVTKAVLNSDKSVYFKALIQDKHDNPMALFRIVNSLLGKNKENPLPPHESISALANDFNSFFVGKIEKIRSKLDALEETELSFNMTVPQPPCELFREFQEVSTEDVKKILSKGKLKSCDLDPLPAAILKQCLDILLPVIVHIVNVILASSCMPASLKQALVIPHLKKTTLELLFPSYRPVSNLAFIGKVTEKVAANQLISHMSDHGIGEIFQSSYKEFHSTETALLRVNNDILRALDKGQCVLLILLDLSAAFDTIDHGILLERLVRYVGVTGSALQWFKDYLTDRKQNVLINGHRSAQSSLAQGVPQGSVLGPILFTVYMLPLGKIMRHHDLDYHFYADDSQLYLVFQPVQESADTAIDRMMSCISDVRSWMGANKLMLNDQKSEYMIVTKNGLPDDVKLLNFKIGESVIEPSESLRNLGSRWDKHMNMSTHVANISKACFMQLRNLWSIKKFVDSDTLVTLTHAFVTSKLDYGNALLYGIPKNTMSRLQYVQNCAARLIRGARKFDHVTPLLIDLHWLPMTYRPMFKILLTVFKILQGRAPEYLTELITIYNPGRSLRSNGNLILNVPRSNTKSWGDRAFSIAGPRLWNSLPIELRTTTNIEEFKSRLKTHLFNMAFEGYL